MTKILAIALSVALSFSSVAAACGCNTNDIPAPVKAKMIKELEKKSFSKYSSCMRTFGEKSICFNEEARSNPRGFAKLLKEFQK